MGFITDMATGEVRETPDCACRDVMRDDLQAEEERTCEHGWQFKNVDAGPYGRVIVWRKVSTDGET